MCSPAGLEGALKDLLFHICPICPSAEYIASM